MAAPALFAVWRPSLVSGGSSIQPSSRLFALSARSPWRMMNTSADPARISAAAAVCAPACACAGGSTAVSASASSASVVAAAAAAAAADGIALAASARSRGGVQTSPGLRTLGAGAIALATRRRHGLLPGAATPAPAAVRRWRAAASPRSCVGSGSSPSPIGGRAGSTPRRPGNLCRQCCCFEVALPGTGVCCSTCSGPAAHTGESDAAASLRAAPGATVRRRHGRQSPDAGVAWCNAAIALGSAPAEGLRATEVAGYERELGCLRDRALGQRGGPRVGAGRDRRKCGPALHIAERRCALGDRPSVECRVPQPHRLGLPGRRCPGRGPLLGAGAAARAGWFAHQPDVGARLQWRRRLATALGAVPAFSAPGRELHEHHVEADPCRRAVLARSAGCRRSTGRSRTGGGTAKIQVGGGALHHCTAPCGNTSVRARSQL
mmetsp:Transcript_52051/g.167471  ORF Transcript_52051/g.167471 Transcript_52051/m.167471 type:complete len:436 (-) Transcript_52051:10-1317(-)